MAGPCGDLTNAPVWVASRVITLGEVYYDSVSGSLQAATTGGTSKTGAAPSFSATAGVTTTDNTVTWTSLGPTSNYTTPFKYPHARISNAFATNWGVAGNNFFIANNHAETQSTALSIAPPGTNANYNPSLIYSVDTTNAPPTNADISAGASISTTGASALTFSSSNNVSWYIYGVTFNAGSGANTANLIPGQGGTFNASIVVYDTCTFNLTNTNASQILLGSLSGVGLTSDNIRFINCVATFGATTQSVSWDSCQGAWIGGSFAATGSVPVTFLKGGSSHAGAYLFRDVDFSAITGTLLNVSSTSQGFIKLQNCKLGTGVILVGGTPNAAYDPYVAIHNSDSASTNYRYYYQTGFGTAQQETTVVRTGSSATNGTTPISWNITTSANAKFPTMPFISEEIAQWSDLTTGSHTVTFYLTTNTTLNNNDCWAEIETLGTSGFPLGVVTTSRMALLGTPAALMTDSSTWGGSITNKYSITLTYTAVNKGPIKARISVAKASVTVYVDPYIYIT